MAHPDNHFYGHNDVLARYARVRGTPVVWGHVQHGWVARNGLPLSHPARLVPWLDRFVWSELNAQQARDAGIAHVTAIGAPFCYLEQQETRGTQLQASTIFYPAHSIRGFRAEGSHREMANEIAERETNPVTVCLYWIDYLERPIRRAYQEKGFRVICHGKQSDQDFLRNQHAELLRHHRVVSNRVTTALWYGGLLGRHIEVYGPTFIYPTGDAREGENYDTESRAHWPELFSGGLTSELAREVAATELGQNCTRSPEELIQLFGWSGKRLRFGPAFRALTLAGHYAIGVEYHARARLPGSKLPRA